jgi:hypothetical protein
LFANSSVGAAGLAKNGCCGWEIMGRRTMVRRVGLFRPAVQRRAACCDAAVVVVFAVVWLWLVGESSGQFLDWRLCGVGPVGRCWDDFSMTLAGGERHKK